MKKSRVILLALALFAFWLLLSGHYDLFHSGIGLLCSLGIALMHRRLFNHSFFPDQFSAFRMRYGFFFLRYIPWLLWQIVLSAIAVSKAVLAPRRVDPQLVRFRVDLKSSAARTILGNSITLTPGTITVLLDDQEYLVHGLMDETAGSLADGSFQTMIARIYERAPRSVLLGAEIIKSKKGI